MGFSIRNAGDEPVYQMVVSLVGIQGAGPPRDATDAPEGYEFRTCVNIVPPGQFAGTMPYAGHGMNIRFGLEIAFSDASGVHWVRKGNGTLRELPVSGLRHYKIDEPVGWESLQPEPPGRA